MPADVGPVLLLPDSHDGIARPMADGAGTSDFTLTDRKQDSYQRSRMRVK